MRRRRALPWMVLAAGAGALLHPVPAAAQIDLGVGIHVADTRTNAWGASGTVAWTPPWPVAFRLFVDAEKAVGDFKPGLGYDEPDRHYIVDRQDVPQNPKDDDLWHGQSWNVHAATYVTTRIWRLSPGFGGFYNGHDAHLGPGAVLVVHTTRASELDVEFLEGGSFRLRVSIVLASWP